MNDTSAMREASIRNSGCSALLCSTLGFVLLEVWLIRLGAKPIAHVIVVSLGALLASLTCRTLLPRQPASVPGEDDRIRPHNRWWNGAVLVVLGYAGAAAFSSDSTTLFGAFTACACLFPWSKIALCRRRVLVPLVLVSTAMCVGLSTAERLPRTPFYLIAVWMLGLAAVISWLSNIYYRKQRPAPFSATAG